MMDRSNSSQGFHPMTEEAYKFWSTPLKGVVLGRFVTFDNMVWVSESIGRPLTLDEVQLIVDFERDDQGDPIMAKCAVTGASFPAVYWVVPNRNFCALIAETGDVRQAGEEADLHAFGCFYLNEKEPLNDPIAISGAPCPGFVKSEGRFQQSSLRDMMKETGGHHRGIPRFMVQEIQLDIRDAEEHKLSALTDTQEKRQKEEEREQRRLELAEKIKGLASDFGLAKPASQTKTSAPASTPSTPHEDTYVAPVRTKRVPVGRGVKRTVKHEPLPELQSA